MARAPDVCYTELSGKDETHLYGQATQGGCSLALGTSPASSAPPHTIVLAPCPSGQNSFTWWVIKGKHLPS